MQSFSFSDSPSVPVVISVLLHHVHFSTKNSNNSASNAKLSSHKKDQKRHGLEQYATFFDYCLSVFILVLFGLPPHSVLCLLKPLTSLARQWPEFLNIQKQTIKSPLLRFLVEGGPFGPSCGKILDLMGTYILLSVQYNKSTNKLTMSNPPPAVFQWGQIPSTRVLCAVTAMSIAPIAIIKALKKIKSRNNTSEQSAAHQLTSLKHAWLLCLAFGNALCEEMLSRGLFHYELMSSAGLSRRMANLIQAASFGMAHYYSLPLGWTGVFVTFVYGWMMGELMYFGEGLYLPVLVHTIQGYFLFVSIARKKAVAKTL